MLLSSLDLDFHLDSFTNSEYSSATRCWVRESATITGERWFSELSWADSGLAHHGANSNGDRRVCSQEMETICVWKDFEEVTQGSTVKKSTSALSHTRIAIVSRDIRSWEALYDTVFLSTKLKYGQIMTKLCNLRPGADPLFWLLLFVAALQPSSAVQLFTWFWFCDVCFGAEYASWYGCVSFCIYVKVMLRGKKETKKTHKHDESAFYADDTSNSIRFWGTVKIEDWAYRFIIGY